MSCLQSLVSCLTIHPDSPQPALASVEDQSSFHSRGVSETLTVEQRGQIVNQPVWQADAAQESKRQIGTFLEGSKVDAARAEVLTCVQVNDIAEVDVCKISFREKSAAQLCAVQVLRGAGLRRAGLRRSGVRSAGLRRSGMRRAGLHRSGLRRSGFFFFFFFKKKKKKKKKFFFSASRRFGTTLALSARHAFHAANPRFSSRDMIFDFVGHGPAPSFDPIVLGIGALRNGTLDQPLGSARARRPFA